MVISTSVGIIAFCVVLFLSTLTADQGYKPQVPEVPEENIKPIKLNHFSIPAVEITNTEQLSKKYWIQKAQAHLMKKNEETCVEVSSANQKSRKPVKNLIMFMGDGMSIPTITAARIFNKERLSFEKFPHFGLAKTYCLDSMVADSASTATAYLSGVKTNLGTIGVNAQVQRKDCKRGQVKKYHTESIAAWAQAAGKWTGLVTTTGVTHASPAGVYAHVADRGWESDTEVLHDNCDPEEVVDIARQLVYGPVGRQLRVILGGGWKYFKDQSMTNKNGEAGRRSDGRNLIQEWIKQKLRASFKTQFCIDKMHLDAIDYNETDYLMGLFSRSHMPFHNDFKNLDIKEFVPSLSEMTEAAIKLLRRSESGFFLFVEGGKIDLAHHGVQAALALEETVEFSKAVEVALNMTSAEDTLIVVIADHSHTMTISGYPRHDDNILGLMSKTFVDDFQFSTLSYANGPNYERNDLKYGQGDEKKHDFDNPKRRYIVNTPLSSETHGGDDTGIFAHGPYAEMFSGNYEQSFIPIIMAHAAKIGPFSNK